MLEQKLTEFTNMMVANAAALGLVFVNGPGPEPVSTPTVNEGSTNGQQRGVYLFALADAGS